MADYKDSLNLPKTDFPMKANLANKEPELLAQWQSQELYQQIRKKQHGKKTFILHDGPPYANGHLHCGHALNKILKDIVIKSKTLSDYDAPFIPGWDCHGLPIELNVEKKLGRAGDKVDQKTFRAACRDYATSQIELQKEEFKRLGVFGDWENPYVTMDYRYEADVIRALGLMLEQGHLQQGFKPVHWCIDCGSALAEAEVEYEEKTSASIDVAFYAVEPEAFLHHFKSDLPQKPLILPIWTTTPWTLPANEAVCLHPEMDYSLISTPNSYFLLATELVDSAMARYKLTDYQILGSLKGQTFEYLKLKHPFFARQLPVILGTHVTSESGTGCVHTAPAHGPDDYQIGATYQLPLINPVKTNGCFIDGLEYVGGLHVLKANAPILNLLTEKKVLLSEEKIRHSYPHCWRHKSPMIFLATPQWFISMEKAGLRQQILQKIEQVEWIPEWGQARIGKMLASRPDWCISRQRAWGTPMPFFLHRETRELHPNTLTYIDQIASLVEKTGIDAWFELDIHNLLGEDADLYEKMTDTMDVWLDSGVTHFAVLKKRLSFPADLYLEGSDQHRGWFNSSLTTSVAMYGEAPYKTVLTHGYTVDAEGKKLSKSKGNYVALDKLVAQYGADVLRLWVSSTDYRHEVSISEEIMKRTSEAYRRIRNTARFLLANLFDFDPQTDTVAPQQMVELDRWILKRAQILQQETILAYEQFQFHQIYQKIHNFCAVDLGSFYLDLIKDRQYTTAKTSPARRSCQTVMYHLIKAFHLWIAPILSFTAEEMAAYIPGASGHSVFLEGWYQDWPEIVDLDLAVWDELYLVRNDVNKALEEQRDLGLIGSALAAEVTLYAGPKLLPKLTRLGKELRFLLITSEASVQSAQTTDNLLIEVKASPYEKCCRCWHRRPEVGQDALHPELCSRCIANINGQPEERIFI